MLPEVLCVTCPAADGLGVFVDRLWPLVPTAVTAEDASRAEFYRQERVRDAVREQTSFAEFLERLQLEVDVRPLSDSAVERCAQLIRRIHQFTLRAPAEDGTDLARWQQENEVWTASARDRFGDYGQVGLLAVRPDGDTLDVAAWMLSCRALGRGVEERLLRWLAERAEALRCSGVRLTAEYTSRNGRPGVWSPLSAAATSRTAGWKSWRRWNTCGPSGPGNNDSQQRQGISMDSLNEDAVVRSPGIDRRHEGESIEHGGGSGLSVADLLARARRPGAPEPVAATSDAAGWDVERLAAAIAAQAAHFLPGVPIDPDADLFELGATSVDAVELVAVLARELGIQLSLDDVLADARPGRLAQRWLEIAGIQAPQAGPAPASSTDEDLSSIMADLARIDHLPWVGATERAAPRRILLTGATGFLGSHLLLDLLRQGDAQVVCLVRAVDEEEGLKRLADALTRFRLPWSAEVRRRVTVLTGESRGTAAGPARGSLGHAGGGAGFDRQRGRGRGLPARVSVAAAEQCARPADAGGAGGGRAGQTAASHLVHRGVQRDRYRLHGGG